MTDPHTSSPSVSTAPVAPALPEAAQPSGSRRLPYLTPRLQPLGEWTALTLVTSLPIGPGGMVFGGDTQA